MDSYRCRPWATACLVLVLVGGYPSIASAAVESANGPAAGTYCSLYEGDGASPVSSEGWTDRSFGTTTITGAVSGGETVALRNDNDMAQGGWMQRFTNFTPPFNLSVRGRYDPTTIRGGLVDLAHFFTGTHAGRAALTPTQLRIIVTPPITLPATQGAWYNVTFEVLAPLSVNVYVNGAFAGSGELTRATRIVFDQPNYQPVILSLTTDPPGTALGMVDYIRTTACPPTVVGPVAQDLGAPLSVAALGDGTVPPASPFRFVREGFPSALLYATTDDTTTGGSAIWSANYTVGAGSWPGTPMTPVDLAFDSPVEDFAEPIDVSALPIGSHTRCVYGRDYYGNWAAGAPACAVLQLVGPEPPEVSAVLLDDAVRTPSASLTIDASQGVWLNATIDDSRHGRSDVAAANWTLGAGAFPGFPMTPADGSFDSETEGVTAWLPPYSVGIGPHVLCVSATDAWGQENLTASCASLTVNGFPPSSVVGPLPYWYAGVTSVAATASDGTYPLVRIGLEYRYAANNVTWGPWTPFGEDNAAPWEWTFDFPDGEGHYGLRSIASDAFGASEAGLSLPDVVAGFDATPPTTSVLPLSPYWRTGGDVLLTAAATDPLSGVASVSLYYRHSTDNASWTPWSFTGSVPSPGPFTVSFTPTSGDGYYEFRSESTDRLGFAFSDALPDARVALDSAAPSSVLIAPARFWQTSTPIALTANAVDGLSGLGRVTLYSRFSIDNASWGPWSPWGSDGAAPWSWNFAPSAGGFYEAYSTSQDRAGNQESGGIAGAIRFAYDATAPASILEAMAEYWTSSPSLTVTATASDGASGVARVTLSYRYSPDNASFGAWTQVGVDTVAPFSWSFTAAQGDGFYQGMSHAEDQAGNAESSPGIYDSSWAIDSTPPQTAVDSVTPYLLPLLPFLLTAQGSDALSGLQSIELFVRYAPDNVTWSAWQSLGSVLPSSATWVFTAASGEGHYQLYSIGADRVGNREPAPAVADLILQYVAPAPPDITAPRVVATVPSNDAVSVPADATVTILFSEPMDQTATEGAFALVGPRGTVTGSFTWTTEERFEFVPDERLERGQGYRITLAQGATDLAGNPIDAPLSAQFTAEADLPASALNWKPLVALMFTVNLLAVAILSATRRRQDARPAPIGRIAAVAAAFIGSEVATGVGSLFFPLLAIPPVLGIGFAVDSTILAVGVVTLLVLGARKPGPLSSSPVPYAAPPAMGPPPPPGPGPTDPWPPAPPKAP